ncbi:formate dehydrogenase accessory protein FdhE [Formicincola oecophyllae]|uniref:Formate dehydrogenase accessory protein FdhE n=1 Tax=Formicincola oecophyllae TaxID=2558361 RepID=A0A4Y6UA26_9PROT|nr:formate dehydrogenase accessory protein FdhE [Formicincola oecophyllae]QDH13287.1 formate dehydrogenase accessory protein FdhE [Formicincola oecophyllae]
MTSQPTNDPKQTNRAQPNGAAAPQEDTANRQALKEVQIKRLQGQKEHVGAAKRRAPATLPNDQPDTATMDAVPPIEGILSPQLGTLYERRLAQFKKLALEAGETNGGPYLGFLAVLTAAQRNLLQTAPLPAGAMATMQAWLNMERMPNAAELAAATFWQVLFKRLVMDVSPLLTPEHAQRLHDLAADRAALSQQAASLLAGDFLSVDGAVSAPLWAALSLAWAQGAQRLLADENAREARTKTPSVACPACGGLPTGSLLMGGKREGLRYQHCALCETRWHRVRSVCTQCGDGQSMDYWSVDDREAPMEVESCGQCQTYVKVFRLDRAPDLEPVASDFASLMLDDAVGREGFTRATVNPYALPV